MFLIYIFTCHLIYATTLIEGKITIEKAIPYRIDNNTFGERKL